MCTLCFSGLLTTRNTLDREGRPNYVLLLFARETSTSRVCINYISSGHSFIMINVPVSSTFNNVIWFFQSATATLSISILDINDNNPQFLNNQLYTFSVQEGQSSQVSVGSVTVSYPPHQSIGKVIPLSLYLIQLMNTWERYPLFNVLTINALTMLWCTLQAVDNDQPNTPNSALSYSIQPLPPNTFQNQYVSFLAFFFYGVLL